MLTAILLGRCVTLVTLGSWQKISLHWQYISFSRNWKVWIHQPNYLLRWFRQAFVGHPLWYVPCHKPFCSPYLSIKNSVEQPAACTRVHTHARAHECSPICLTSLKLCWKHCKTLTDQAYVTSIHCPRQQTNGPSVPPLQWSAFRFTMLVIYYHFPFSSVTLNWPLLWLRIILLYITVCCKYCFRRIVLYFLWFTKQQYLWISFDMILADIRRCQYVCRYVGWSNTSWSHYWLQHCWYERAGCTCCWDRLAEKVFPHTTLF